MMVDVKRYKNTNAYQRDAAQRQIQGWRVISTTSEEQRAGCMRILLTGGLGLLFWKPKPVLVVTYER